MKPLGQPNAPPWSIEREIKKKRLECDVLKMTYDSALAKYYSDEGTDEDYDNANAVRLDLNICIDELNELIDTETYGPRIPVQSVRQNVNPWNPQPTEPTEPTEPQEPEAAAPATIAPAPWPSEVPEPKTEPFTGEEEKPTEPASCDPLKGQFYDPRTQQCRSSVSSFKGPSFNAFGPSTTAPLSTQALTVPPTVSSFAMSGRAMLGRVRLVHRP